MTKKNEIENIIKQILKTKGLKIECPECGDEFSAKKANLFNMYGGYPVKAQRKLARNYKDLQEEEDELNQQANDIKEKRKELRGLLKTKPEAVKKSTESINFGQITEKIIPSFDEFPYKQKDCRSLFDPVDYIVFNGLSRAGKVDLIKVIDVKSGNARLNKRQTEIKDAISAGKIFHKIIEK